MEDQTQIPPDPTEDPVSPPTAPPPSSHIRRNVVAGVLAGVLVLGGAGTTYLVTHDSNKPAPAPAAATQRPNIGTSGKITSINGSSITVATSAGAKTVDLTSAKISVTNTKTVSDINPGDTVSLVVDNNNVTSIQLGTDTATLPAAANGPAGTPPSGAFPRGASTTSSTRNGSASGTNPFSGTRVSGTVVSVDTSSITLMSDSTSNTYAITSATTVRETATGSLSDLHVGDQVSVLTLNGTTTVRVGNVPPAV